MVSFDSRGKFAREQIAQHVGDGDAAPERGDLDPAAQLRRHVDGEPRGEPSALLSRAALSAALIQRSGSAGREATRRLAAAGVPVELHSYPGAIHAFNGVPAKAVIEGVSLMINLAAVTSGMTSFRLHLYKTSPTAVLDNAAFDLVAGDRTAYVGYIDIPAPTDLGATLFVQVDQVNKRVSAPGGVLYGVLQTVGGYTPTSSEDYTLTLRVLEA